MFEDENVVVYELGDKKYFLDKRLAKKAFDDKRVINGRESSSFNVLPLKYSWAYELYRTMESNHWIPHEIPMFDDVAQWGSDSDLSDCERNIIKFGLGYFSESEGIVGDCVHSVIREKVTAPELKMALGRHVQEENIHTESLLYMISSLGINPHEVNAMFISLDSIVKKNELITRKIPVLKKDVDLRDLNNKRKFAELIFGTTQVLEGSAFFALFLPILHLCRCGKMPGVGQMFRYTIRDESNHIELGRRLLLDLFAEEPEIADQGFINSMTEFMIEAMELEKNFVDDLLPVNLPGLCKEDIKKFVCYNANRRLVDLGWNPVVDYNGEIIKENPCPWAAEVIYLKKCENFFETSVTEYSKVSSLSSVDKESDLFEGIVI